MVGMTWLAWDRIGKEKRKDEKRSKIPGKRWNGMEGSGQRRITIVVLFTV
jgi:hypothetical protein